ncbi:MAG: baseplate J/gp47 family protein [Desulfobacteraceae bacterium]|nr:baseplate J/gp47 family protein [Desulfobacteraceae bacterium]
MSFENLPDIQFCETETESIEQSIITVYEALTDKTLFPGDPVRLFLETLSAVIVQQRVAIDYAGKQNLLSLADDNFLDHIGTFTNTDRLSATAATATVRFSIGENLDFAVPIEQGIRVSPDGQLWFETVSYTEVLAGQSFVDVTVRCQTAGSAGNGFLPGQINKMVDPVSYISSVSNTDTSAGGSDAEDKEAYRLRIQTAPESFSVAGPTEAYAHWAKSANASITDVSVFRTSPLDDLTEEQLTAVLTMLGTDSVEDMTVEHKKIEVATRLSSAVVNVCPLTIDGSHSSDALLEQVQSALNDSSVRPLTDLVQVSAPVEVGYDIDLKYYISQDNKVTATEIQQAVQTALDDFIFWQKARLGRDINPDKLTTLLINAGAMRIELNSPAYKQVNPSQVASLNEKNLVYGGLKDE